MGDVPGWAYVVGTPLWACAVIYAIRTTKDWSGIMGRWNERQRDRAKIDDGLYTRLAERVAVLEGKVAACEEDRDEWKSRAIFAEAALIARQDAEGRVQRRVSEEREIDASKRKKNDK